MGPLLGDGDGDGDSEPSDRLHDGLDDGLDDGLNDKLDDGVSDGAAGLGNGDGQFCCSITASSLMGPSSMDPRLTDIATHGTAGSHRLTPSLGMPLAVSARAAAMDE
jgi:hypothetical protein